jgi:hypothetical protein
MTDLSSLINISGKSSNEADIYKMFCRNHIKKSPTFFHQNVYLCALKKTRQNDFS